MKLVRILLASILVLALLAAVGCESTPSGTASSASAGASSSGGTPIPSLPSVDTESSEEELILRDERGYVITRNMVTYLNLSFNDDTSACFPEDAPGYVITGGPYKVDAATLKRISTVPCEGDGTVRWIRYKRSADFDGAIPASRLNDPVYLCMNVPGDVRTYYLNPGNGYNMNAVDSRHTNLLSIGAVYRNEDNPPPDDMEITLCFRDIRLVLHTPEKGWFVADEQKVPTDGMVNSIYYLPWGHKPSDYKLADAAVNQFEDHTEVKLTGADLNGKKSTDTDAAVLHFWGRTTKFKNLGITWDQIDGILVSYYVWVKEPEAVGHLTATIGADLREVEGGKTDQVFTAHNNLITTQPTNVIGHNVPNAKYGTLMNVDLVHQLIGLK